ncbi:hypothetical protein MY1884_008946, partial [Beauveria asiatica]
MTLSFEALPQLDDSRNNSHSNSSEKNAPTWESLPKLSEVISSARPGQYPAHHDQRSVSGNYARPHTPALQPWEPGHMPTGQMPLPAAPIPPNHEHNDAPCPQTHEPGPYARYGYSAPHHFVNSGNQASFELIAGYSYAILNFAEAFLRTALQPQLVQPIPECLPSEHEVDEVVAHVDSIRHALNRIRAEAQGAYDKGHGMKAQDPVHEVKKRRG